MSYLEPCVKKLQQAERLLFPTDLGCQLETHEHPTPNRSMLQEASLPFVSACHAISSTWNTEKLSSRIRRSCWNITSGRHARAHFAIALEVVECAILTVLRTGLSTLSHHRLGCRFLWPRVRSPQVCSWFIDSRRCFSRGLGLVWICLFHPATRVGCASFPAFHDKSRPSTVERVTSLRKNPRSTTVSPKKNDELSDWIPSRVCGASHVQRASSGSSRRGLQDRDSQHGGSLTDTRTEMASAIELFALKPGSLCKCVDRWPRRV